MAIIIGGGDVYEKKLSERLLTCRVSYAVMAAATGPHTWSDEYTYMH